MISERDYRNALKVGLPPVRRQDRSGPAAIGARQVGFPYCIFGLPRYSNNIFFALAVLDVDGRPCLRAVSFTHRPRRGNCACRPQTALRAISGEGQLGCAGTRSRSNGQTPWS